MNFYRSHFALARFLLAVVCTAMGVVSGFAYQVTVYNSTTNLIPFNVDNDVNYLPPGVTTLPLNDDLVSQLADGFVSLDTNSDWLVIVDPENYVPSANRVYSPSAGMLQSVDVSSLIDQFMSGLECGSAVAALLFGWKWVKRTLSLGDREHD